MQEVLTEPFRQRLQERLSSRRPCPTGRFSGRGIVTCAGGPRYFTCAWVLIWTLRRVLRSKLPIQVWHLGAVEMSAGMRAILDEEGVEVVDAEAVLARHPARVARGWPLKPYAIAHSRFQEVLYLDADTVPLAEPSAVFDWSAYRDSGLLFWPDILDIKAENPIWAKVGLAPQSCVSVDSGILAVDKTRAFAALDIAILLNEHWEEIYELLHGDKDTFLLACRLVGHAEAMIPHRPFDFDFDLVQRDPQGDAFLHHRTAAKWNLNGRNRPVATAMFNAECDAALAELRRRWNGVVFHAPPGGEAARAAEAAIVATRRFAYVSTHGAPRAMELLAGNRVGEGRAEYEQHWAVVQREGAIVLQFYSDVQLHVELTQLEDGSWRGATVVQPHFSARLVAESIAQGFPGQGAERIARTSAEVVAGLLAAAAPAAGYDVGVARDLAAALVLVNGAFDDVPEELAAHLARRTFDSRWSDLLGRLARDLSAARDRRVALGRDRAKHPIEINLTHYLRVL
jgi:hypothetical protein